MSLYNDASLVMIPSAYKDGKLYSIKPTDGSGDFTFSRGSNLAATRVDENGLIEKGRENLLLRSNQFDTSWTLSSASLASGQSGYDGTNDAWLFTTTIAGATLTQSITASGVVVFSMYAKKGTVNGIRLRIDAATDADAFFNLFNGSVYSFTGSAIDASMISLGSGWYRCQMSANISSPVKVAVYTTNGTTAYDNGNIYIQDAQLEAGLVATDYIETTTTTAQAGILEDMPRLDYSGGASCPSLLLEPQRTNELAHSEYIGAFGASNVSVTSNTEISPQGVRNAATIEVTTQTAVEGIAQGFVADGSSLYTISAYYKKTLSSTRAQLKIRDLLGSGTTYGFVDFDLSDGSVSASIGTYSITSFNDDWWYVAVTTSSAPSAGIRRAIVRLDNQPVGTQISVFGFQVESGSYPTSYIPCYGAATTRSYEVYDKTSATSLIGQEQGVLFVDFVPNSETATQWVAFLGSGNKYIGIYIGGSSRVTFEVANVTSQAGFLGSTIVKGQRYKCAIAYAENDFAAYVNGVQIGTDSSGSVPAVNTIRNYYNTNIQSIDTNQLALFKTRLTNGELAALTTI